MTFCVPETIRTLFIGYTPIKNSFKKYKIIQFGRQFGGFLTTLNIFLPYIPAITLFGTYPNELKTFGDTKNSMQMFIATLFTIDKAWEQP